MKCFTFHHRVLSPGIAVQSDNRMGIVVYLGEEGRGRRYQKVGLFHRSPAEVVDGRVFEAHPVKFTLPATEGKPERVFWTLAMPTNDEDQRVLVRVNTSQVYTRDSVGGWSGVKGKPPTLIVGHGAHGDAGRIGTWDDGLVLMSPGDVLRVKPEGGYKTPAFALIYDEKGLRSMPFEDYEGITASDFLDGEYV